MYAFNAAIYGRPGTIAISNYDRHQPISNPANPTQVHRLPSSQNNRNADVAFDPRDGIYYRTLEPNKENSGKGHFGFEVIDYGFKRGNPKSPSKVGKAKVAGPTHNLRPHPDPSVPLLYTVNEETWTPGLEIWDVTKPAKPKKVADAGPQGGLHDAVIEENDNMHCAYIFADESTRGFRGYAILDLNDPRNPSVIGKFDYAGTPDYGDTNSLNGHDGFELCHYARKDPGRDVAIVGDEIATGTPGGKHLFDRRLASEFAERDSGLPTRYWASRDGLGSRFSQLQSRSVSARIFF